MLNRRTSPRRDDGISLVLMSLLMVALLGIAALVVDLGSWQVDASEAQQAADAAALAGVVRLPQGIDAARARALEIASDNGFDNADPNVDVTVSEQGDETLAVTVTLVEAGQFFSRVFRPASSITRTSTAQYVQPVPLGSPRNYLGTNVLPLAGVTAGSDAVENFYLAVSGKCSRREHGDRVGGKSASNPPGNAAHSCAPTTTDPTSGVIENPEFDPNAYLFGVSVPVGAPATALQMFDAPVCTARPGSDRIFGETNNGFDTRITVRRNNAVDPLSGTELTPPFTIVGRSDLTGVCTAGSTTGGECSSATALRECWHTLFTLPGPGEYTVQIQSIDSGVDDRLESHNVFALRAKTGAGFTGCTGDIAQQGNASATPQYSSTCPQVFGLEHLPIFARGSNSPLFFLSSIDDRHVNKTLQVTFFDTAEGATGLELVDPGGTSVPFTWEILCDHGTPAPASGTCPGENQPIGGRSGSSSVNPSTGRQYLPLPADFSSSNFANRIYGSRSSQPGGYSDRLIRITYDLPPDFATPYGNRTWWKVRYLGNFGGDRTTWSVQLLGDPVRLLPNSPPAPPTP